VLARHPLITYDAAFAAARISTRPLPPATWVDIVLAAIDSDVIKTYVELGRVGIMAAMAFDPARDRDLRMLDAAHLFRTNTTRIAVLRDGACAPSPTRSSRCLRRTCRGVWWKSSGRQHRILRAVTLVSNI
jgi:hypothetical protein